MGDLNKRGHLELMETIWVQKALGPNFIDLFQRDKSPSFTVVRHPIYRLVSAWLEKLGPIEPGHSEKDKDLHFVICRNFEFEFYLFSFFLNLI